MALEGLLDSFDGPFGPAKSRGVGRIYLPRSDYYLLWRTASKRAAPYPDELFRNPDPLTPDDERQALVQGAYAATVIRSRDDAAQLDSWLCSWRPSAQFKEAVASVLREHHPPLSCLKDEAEVLQEP